MKSAEYIFLWVFGGSIYYGMEMASRGYSHWTMFLLGGICFILCGIINNGSVQKYSMLEQMIISMFLITFLEYAAGVILNMCLELNIWDYSYMPFNLYGQICVPYAVLWFGLSLPTIILDDYLKYWLYRHKKPFYRWI